MTTLNNAATVPAVLLGVLIAVLARATYCVLFHPLAEFPGPRIARVTGLWRSWRFFSGNWHEDILDLHQKYGCVVRIAPNELSVVGQDITHALYGPGSTSTKSPWYGVWVTNPAAPGMFATQDQRQHSFLRKRVAKAYSLSTVLASEADMQDCLDAFLQKMKLYSDSTGVVDMTFWTSALAFDVVGKLSIGTSLGMVASGTDIMGLAKNIFQIFAMTSNLGHFPGQFRIINNSIVHALMAWLGTPNPMLTFQAWSLARIEERIQSGSSTEHQDMLSHFVTMQNGKEGAAAPEDILMETMIVIGAGADTVASAMRSCLLYICLHPRVYRRVQQEIDSLEVESSITYSQTHDLSYLRAACNEAMRLFPSIVFPLPRCIASDLSIDGKPIPAGTVVSVSPGAQNRDPTIFGPDPHCYRPERWLESDTTFKTMAQNVMTFGGNGPRNCIGQNIALVEIYKFIAQTLQNFDVAFCDPASPWRVTSYWIAYQREMSVILTPRKAEMQDTSQQLAR